MVPMPMVMFSAVMYLVCRSVSGEESGAEKPKTHIFDKADHSEDRKSRGLPDGVDLIVPCSNLKLLWQAQIFVL